MSQLLLVCSRRPGESVCARARGRDRERDERNTEGEGFIDNQPQLGDHTLFSGWSWASWILELEEIQGKNVERFPYSVYVYNVTV